ncbi:MAG: MiaB-like protein tRNA modifying enzyme [uncultured bacterium (gcode 4)]|uniref:MiaB-like protein tRNA modifying enzyme n=1 Tax=uncultured bacterium (gcode 4) TaxID=1234023 RepID=K2G5X5_9BACT|nr:MAG: MiaB-like protein tRNA modifying enzyme [uncultured bacterium (gcode 4)]
MVLTSRQSLGHFFNLSGRLLIMEYKIFWCKTNRYYTEKWLDTKYLQDKQWIFVASCIVTEKAKSKWLKFVISNIEKFGSEEKLYLSGCWTIKKWELTEDFYDTYPELKKYESKIVLLGEDPMKEWIQEKIDKLRSKRIFTRKYLIIQNWCDNYCTFCVTIQARWEHSSREEESIRREIEEFVNSGGKEVVITWTNLWAWWTSNTKNHNETRLSELLRKILNETDVERLRISSLWVEYINGELLEVLQNPRIYWHLHLSIQSWSDKIIKLMNRNYSRKELVDKLEKLRNMKREDWLNLSIWADIIVGFPWEEDSDFQDTLDILKRFNISKVHAFPFSAHENRDTIPAAKFPNQVKNHIKNTRMKEILALWDDIRNWFLKDNSWRELKLLIEKTDWESSFSWWSENYIFLNEKNFKIPPSSELKRWNIIKGTYAYIPEIKDENGDWGF